MQDQGEDFWRDLGALVADTRITGESVQPSWGSFKGFLKGFIRVPLRLPWVPLRVALRVCRGSFKGSVGPRSLGGWG